MTSWAIQSNLLDPIQISQIVDALVEQSIPYTGLQILPFIDDITFLTPEPTEQKVIPYGSTKLIRLASEKNWTGMFYNPETFRVDAWTLNRDDMVNQHPIILPIEIVSKVFERVPKDSVWFIRPVEDLKHFNGTVTTAEEISRFTTSKESGNFSFDGDVLAAISVPVNILAEWRWFIVGGKIISGSVYRMRGQRLVQREEDLKVIHEAQQMADKWLPHPVCVMDTALTNEGIRVLEFNCFNSAGFYYHDIKKIVLAATEYLETQP